MEQKTYTFKDTRGLMVTINKEDLMAGISAQKIDPPVETGTVICQITFSERIVPDEMAAFLEKLQPLIDGTINRRYPFDAAVLGYSDGENKKIGGILEGEGIKATYQEK